MTNLKPEPEPELERARSYSRSTTEMTQTNTVSIRNSQQNVSMHLKRVKKNQPIDHFLSSFGPIEQKPFKNNSVEPAQNIIQGFRDRKHFEKERRKSCDDVYASNERKKSPPFQTKLRALSDHQLENGNIVLQLEKQTGLKVDNFRKSKNFDFDDKFYRVDCRPKNVTQHKRFYSNLNLSTSSHTKKLFLSSKSLHHHSLDDLKSNHIRIFEKSISKAGIQKVSSKNVQVKLSSEVNISAQLSSANENKLQVGLPSDQAALSRPQIKNAGQSETHHGRYVLLITYGHSCTNLANVSARQFYQISARTRICQDPLLALLLWNTVTQFCPPPHSHPLKISN
jgi:hypothetical protein